MKKSLSSTQSARALPRPVASAALLLLFSLRATIVSSAQCSVRLRQECEYDNSGFTAKTILYLTVEDADVSTYDADISFHWGRAEDTKISRNYTANSGEVTVLRTHTWDGDGDYYAGYTVSFEGGIGCEKRLHREAYVVWFGDGCGFSEFEGSTVPTMSAVDALTSTPTEAGTEIPIPTKRPSDAPIETPSTPLPTIRSTPRPSTRKPTMATPSPTISPAIDPVIDTPSPSEGSTPKPVTAAPAPTPKPIGCGDSVCDATEHDVSCPTDCVGIVLEAEGGGDIASAPGTMFTVYSPRDVKLKSLHFYSNVEGMDRVEVYAKSGTFEGYESDRSAWKQVYNNYNSLLGGPAESTELNLNNGDGIPIPADAHVSFFVYTESGLRGNVGTASGDYLTNDNVLRIFQGIEVEDKFTAYDGTPPPLSFNGAFEYDVVESVTWFPTSAPDSNAGSPPPSLGVKTPSPNSVKTQEYLVSSAMVLSYSDKLDGDLEASWIEVTEEVIQKETAMYVGVLPSVVKVNVVITDQALIASSRSRMLSINRDMHAMSIGAWRRNLQSSLPLQIEFDTYVRFPSEEENWSAYKMVAGGFRTSSEQARYILDLKSAKPTDFSNLNSMSLEVEGDIVTEPVVEEPAKDNRLYYIIAGAVGGALVLVLSLGIIYYRGQNKRIECGSIQLKAQAVEEDKHGGGGYAPTDTDTFQDTMNHQSYFGTIQRNDFDDISTLGDPYMGEVVNREMNTDITVGESLVSNQEKLFIYGVGKPGVGTGLESRMGDTTITGSKAMLFGEDTTFEDIYETPEGVGEPPSFDFITIVAPSGMLGIVLNDNQGGDFPVVYAVKSTSPLHGRVQVGDMLVTVDEVDCRGVASRTISSFLSSRSQSPMRTMVLARESI